METVTAKGKVYQIGELYIISDDGEIGYLRSYNSEGEYFISSIDKDFKNMHVSPDLIFPIESVGTVTDEPIVLEAGETWMCHYEIQTGSESCEHFELPFCLGINGRFYGVPPKALSFTPKYKMERECT
ncbi:MAG: hypothetical protein JKY14_13605 [Paraglaciecola sp.]|nr:hypothetical protein [Paraglaciecola sp.]